LHLLAKKIYGYLQKKKNTKFFISLEFDLFRVQLKFAFRIRPSVFIRFSPFFSSEMAVF